MNARDSLTTKTRRKSLTDEEGEVRELTSDDLARMRPAREVLPPKLYNELVKMNQRAGVRGPQKAPTKVLLSLRLSPQVIERFRASGPGWQTRIDAVLKNWLRRHKPEEIEA